MNPQQTLIVNTARKHAADQGTTWPGTPLSHLPISQRANLRALIAEGHVTIVEREGARVALRYVVATEAVTA